MDSQLKQRLIGAAVLVAIAVIFLPMLIQGPAPDSGVSDVPLDTPSAPQSDDQTRDLPLVAPDEVPAGGATGMPASAPATTARDAASATPTPAHDDALPTVDTATTPSAPRSPDAADLARPQPMLPASVAGGDYAAHFGSYGNSVSADTVVSRLRAAQLPAYRESAIVAGKPVWRVRVGPYASRADAEAARLRANEVGRQSGSTVVALDADAATPSASQAVAANGASPSVSTRPLPTPASPDPAKAVVATSTKPADAPKPASTPVTSPATTPAAAGVGFAVQIGAFASSAQAAKKRDDLRAAGFSAFTETVKTDKGTLTRVLAGPVVSRAAADQLKSQLKSKTGSDGMVRPHP